MTAAAIHGFEVQASPEIVQHWGWFLAFGIGLLALGVAAVMRSVTATIVSMVFFGWLLLLASGIEIAQAVMVGKIDADKQADHPKSGGRPSRDDEQVEEKGEQSIRAAYCLTGAGGRAATHPSISPKNGSKRKRAASLSWFNATRQQSSVQSDADPQAGCAGVVRRVS